MDKNSIDFSKLDKSSTPKISYNFCKDNELLLLGSDEEKNIYIGKVDNNDGNEIELKPQVLFELRRIFKSKLIFEKISKEYFEESITSDYSNADFSQIEIEDNIFDTNLQSAVKATDLLESDSDAPIIKLINSLIAQATRQGASDIHCEPFEKKFIVRFRIDGALKEVLKLNNIISARFSSRLKVMADLDIAETRIPQDGRISLSLGGSEFDVRISTLPSRFGERIVLRILDKSKQNWNIENIGMDEKIKKQFISSLQKPNGIILVTGPTGSGKTTTLYTGLNYLNDRVRNILTVEDPVEYAIEGIGQTQVNNKTGMTFAKGFRAILRQDPDIVMVGEIRDAETAQIAIQASLTGHLVLSTIHTNSAISSITRLRDMGIASYLISSTLSATIAQRLIRLLCQNCKEASQIDNFKREFFNLEKDAMCYTNKGCEKCDYTGYLGRTGIYEFVTINDDLRKLIHDDVPETELKRYYFKNNLSMYDQAKLLVKEGKTSIEEAIRQVSLDA